MAAVLWPHGQRVSLAWFWLWRKPCGIFVSLRLSFVWCPLLQGTHHAAAYTFCYIAFLQEHKMHFMATLVWNLAGIFFIIIINDRKMLLWCRVSQLVDSGAVSRWNYSVWVLFFHSVLRCFESQMWDSLANGQDEVATLYHPEKSDLKGFQSCALLSGNCLSLSNYPGFLHLLIQSLT